ncbi:hypothetical protein OT109_14015 [Phycisphaeraceae bacterium D3-23]
MRGSAVCWRCMFLHPWLLLFWLLIVLTVFWLPPLLAIGVPVLILRLRQTVWQWRGLERGGVFCAGCRMDLRGAAGGKCAECGRPLKPDTVLTPGITRPMSSGVTILLTMLLSSAGLLVAGVLLMMALPMNYTIDRALHLTPRNSVEKYDTVVVASRREATWWGGRKPAQVRTYQGDGYPTGKRLSYSMDDPTYAAPLPADDDVLLPDLYWRVVVSNHYYWQRTPGFSYTDARLQVATAIRFLAEERPGELPALEGLDVVEHEMRDYEPAGWFVIALCSVSVLFWIGSIDWAQRRQKRALRYYAAQRRRAMRRLARWVAANRAQAGL